MNYEEMQTETVEATVDTEVTTDVDLSAFDEGWDDDGYTASSSHYADVDEVNNEEAEADQQEAEDVDASETTEETEQTEDKNDKGADQRFTLKHLDEVKEVDRDEVINLAQKGMDYDRKVSKLNTKIAEYEDFLNELAAPGNLSIAQLMDSTRARMLMSKEAREGREISETDAIFRVQQARADKAQAEAQAKEQQPTTPSNDAVQKFIAVYPNVKAEDIPQSVWVETQRTGDLLGAYTRYENAELKKQIDAMNTNRKNEQRSTGSRKTAGTGKARDAFDEGWDSI